MVVTICCDCFFLKRGKEDEEGGERVLFLQHDIVIMYSILFVFIIILKMQFFTWIGLLACLFGIIFLYVKRIYDTPFFISLKTT